MLTSVKMELLSIVVLKDHAEETVSRLVKLGVFHPVDARTIEEELSRLQPFQLENERVAVEGCERKLSEVLRKTGLTLRHARELRPHSFEEIDAYLTDADQEASALVEEMDRLSSDLRSTEQTLGEIEGYQLLPFRKEAAHSFLQAYYGKIDLKNLPALKRSLMEIPYVFYPAIPASERDRKITGKTPSVIIGLRRDKDILEKVLKDLAWEMMEYSQVAHIPREAQERMRADTVEFRKKIQALSRKLRDLARSIEDRLAGIQTFLSLKKSILEAKRLSFTTEKTALVTGWIPSEEKKRVVSEIAKADQPSCIEGKKPEDLAISMEDVPVQFRHNLLLRPFELLIDTYGIPRYGTIDPTVFVAVSFLLMFGIMFGDIGHGLVLVLISLFLGRSAGRQIKQASGLLLSCGLSSCFFGLIEGSFFGKEFASVWIKPMESIPAMFKLSVTFGIAVVSLGMAINVINAFRDRDYRKAVFDKSGLIAGVIYWTGIALVTKLYILNTEPHPLYTLIFSAGLLVLFLKPVVEYAFKKERHENIFIVLMESVIEIFEIIIGYLSNTVSFVRVAAFSLAHVGLFLAIFELSRLVKGVWADSLSVIIIVLGNAVVILLEGLVVSIQSLRLNYYEFFSKFFVTGKWTYKPLNYYKE